MNGTASIWRLMALILLAALAPAANAGENWRGGGPGTTDRVGGVNADEFSGPSTHVGRFTGEGFHILN